MTGDVFFCACHRLHGFPNLPSIKLFEFCFVYYTTEVTKNLKDEVLILSFSLPCAGVYSGWGASLAVNLETFSIGQVSYCSVSWSCFVVVVCSRGP